MHGYGERAAQRSPARGKSVPFPKICYPHVQHVFGSALHLPSDHQHLASLIRLPICH
jgi:hypothetical protein